MHTTTRRAAAGLAAAATLGLVAAPAAMAQSGENVANLKRAGDTRLTLASGAAKALKSLGVKVAPLSPARVRSGAIAFPITSGSVDPKLADGALINHSGGLQFSKGRTKVPLRNFRIRITGSQATISAAVGTSRATILTLNASKARITRPALNLRVANVGVSLNATGAAALNRAFKTKAFKKGLKIGTAVVNAQFAQFIVEGGETKVAVDGGTLNALVGAGVTPGVVAPTVLAGTTVNFPITKSKIAADLTSGVIGHTGGITLAKGGTTLSLTDYDIKLGASPSIAATVNGGAPKADVLDLDLAGLQQSVSGQTVNLQGITAKLNATGAGAVSQLAGATIPAGTVFGAATVSANIR